MFPKVTPKETKAWHLLQEHYNSDIKGTTQMRSLFAKEPERFANYSLQFDSILFDYSKNIITGKTLGLLRQLAEESGVASAIEAMFSGEKINQTEDRSVLHIALRNLGGSPIYSDGKDVMPEVFRVLAQMKAFCTKVHNAGNGRATPERK